MKIAPFSAVRLLPRAQKSVCAQAAAQDAFNNAYLLEACTTSDPTTKLLSVLNSCHAIRVPDPAASSWPSVYAGHALTVYAASGTNANFLACVAARDATTDALYESSTKSISIAGIAIGVMAVALSASTVAVWLRRSAIRARHARPEIITPAPESIDMPSIVPQNQVGTTTAAPAYETEAPTHVVVAGGKEA